MVEYFFEYNFKIIRISKKYRVQAKREGK